MQADLNRPLETPEEIAADEALIDICFDLMPDIYPPVTCPGCEDWQIDFPMMLFRVDWIRGETMAAHDEHMETCPGNVL